MKKSSIPSFVFASLTALSLASYIYLQQVASTSTADSIEATENVATKQVSVEDHGILFPSISLLKRVINITKMVRPRD